jgi:hypothetical protein
VTENDFTTSKTLELSPLPCYEHWPAEQYHAWVRETIADIEREGSARGWLSFRPLPTGYRREIVSGGPHPASAL